MIRIYNKTWNEKGLTDFDSVDNAIQFLRETEYGKDGDKLVIYEEDDDYNQRDLLIIEDWGATVGGLDWYLNKFKKGAKK